MGKLTDIVTKGVRLIVADVSQEAAPEGEAASPPPPPRRGGAAGREIAAEDLDASPPRRVAQSEVAADVADFAAVYAEAAIELPTHGYGVDKVAEMLENKRFATLNRDAKAAAVMVALEAAGAPIRDVIQDAVRRDKALDAFEAAKQREVAELKATTEARVQELNRQLEELIQKINAEVQNLKQAAESAEHTLAALQVRKRREEERLQAIVAHFIEGPENPISAGAPQGGPPKPGPA